MAGAGPANRVLLPGHSPALDEIRTFISHRGRVHPALQSHLLSHEIADAFVAGEPQAALRLRGLAMERAIDHTGRRLAEWGRTDRPSIEYLLAKAAAP
jgi:hypothetical protein